MRVHHIVLQSVPYGRSHELIVLQLPTARCVVRHDATLTRALATVDRHALCMALSQAISTHQPSIVYQRILWSLIGQDRTTYYWDATLEPRGTFS